MNRKTFRHLLLYGIFGVLTTVINIWAYWLFTRIFHVRVVPSTVIAWLIAVFFAYYSNRKYVFHSSENSFRGMIREAVSFFACRIATGIMDVIIMYVFVYLLGLHDVIIKTVSNILVIVLNYVASKLLIFKS